jgi:1-deoxy-D-xylulose-5-phosphate synthase
VPVESLNGKIPALKRGKSVKIRSGKDCAIFAVGDMVETARNVADKLEKKGLKATVINLLFLKPLDMKSIENAVRETSGFITIENGSVSGGIGEYILSLIDNNLKGKLIKNFGFPDEFITHGSMEQLFKLHKLDPNSIARIVIENKKGKKM